GPASRTGSVDNISQLFGCDVDVRRTRRLAHDCRRRTIEVRKVVYCDVLPRSGGKLVGHCRVRDQDPWLRIVQHESETFQRIGWIEWKIGSSGFEDRQRRNNAGE